MISFLFCEDPVTECIKFFGKRRYKIRENFEWAKNYFWCVKGDVENLSWTKNVDPSPYSD